MISLEGFGGGKTHSWAFLSSFHLEGLFLNSHFVSWYCYFTFTYTLRGEMLMHGLYVQT